MLQAYALSLMPHCLLPHDSCILPLASCEMSHASCLIVSCLISHVSYFMPHGSWAWLMPYASCLMPHASCLMPRASCLMPHVLYNMTLPHVSRIMPHASRQSLIPQAFCLMPCHLPHPKGPTPHDIAVTIGIKNYVQWVMYSLFSLKPSQNFSHYIENWWPVLLAPKDHPLVGRSKQMKMELQSFCRIHHSADVPDIIFSLCEDFLKCLLNNVKETE